MKKLMKQYSVRYIRVADDDYGLLQQRKLFGSVGPWQDHAYYNNEAYRLSEDMNELCEKLAEKYAKYSKVIKKRNQIHRTIGEPSFQPEGIGAMKEGVKLSFFREDNKPLVKPPSTWLKFVQSIKNGSAVTEGSELTTSVVLGEDSAGEKSYDLVPHKQNGNNQKNNRRNNNNNNNGQH
jgi:hypothetical protein